MILPVKNEPRITSFVEDLHKVLNATSHEVLLQYEDGISNAVWHGLAQAKGEKVVVMDSDGSHSPTDILSMLTQLDKDVDIVAACRIWNHYPLHRRIISYACAWLTRRCLGIRLTDPLTAFIAGKRDKLFFNQFKGCKFALEIIAHQNPNRIQEHPIHHSPQPNHKSKLKPQEGLYFLMQLWRLRKRSL